MRRSLPVVAVCALVLAGCGSKVNVEQTVNLGGERTDATLIIDPPSSEQKVAVTAQAAEPFSLYLVADDETGGMQKRLEEGKVPASPLAKQEDTKSASVEATIPAKKQFYVFLVRAGAPTEVKVSIKSK